MSEVSLFSEHRLNSVATEYEHGQNPLLSSDPEMEAKCERNPLLRTPAY